jgi:glucan-binding YG repeat protein
MKKALKNRICFEICWILLIILAVGWFMPASADAEVERNGWTEEDGRMYFYAYGVALHGCIAEIDGEYYYFRDNGTLLMEDETCRIGVEDDDAFWIRAGWDNILLAGQWYTDDTKDPADIYYYGENFAAACGPTQIDGEFYLFDSESGLLLCNRKVLIEDSWWESDYQGILTPVPNEQGSDEALNGWVMDTDGNTYYFRDGVPLSGGFCNIDGEYRFFHDNGRMAKSESLYLDNQWVRFDEEGRVIPDTNSEPENNDIAESNVETPVGTEEKPTPTDDTATTLDGWMTIDGERYYYRNGKPISAGCHFIDWREYYFDENGRMAKSESLYIDDHWIRFDEDGYVIPDTNSGPENYDIAESDVEIPVGTGEKPTPTDDTATPLEGWMTIDGERYYYRNGQPISAGRHYIEWTEYYFDENGRVIPDTNGEPENHDFSESASENSAGNGENPVSTDNTAAPWEGWMTVDGERYYYRNGQPISAGRHYIEWIEYYFDENGRLLHDCIADDHVLASDGSIVQSGLVKLGDQQYYVNPETHLIERNTEVNIDNKLYLVDADGNPQIEDMPGMPVPESATEPAAADSSSDEALPESDPDPDAGYMPVNEDDGGVQETLPAGGSIRYSDDYESDSASSAGKGADGAPASDNPSSGMLLWRGGEWVELHGNPENPIEIHIYGRRAAFMNGGTALRDAFLCNSEGVYGFDSFGGALPAGFVTRYGKLFYLSAPDPDAEMLVLLLS